MFQVRRESREVGALARGGPGGVGDGLGAFVFLDEFGGDLRGAIVIVPPAAHVGGGLGVAVRRQPGVLAGRDPIADLARREHPVRLAAEIAQLFRAKIQRLGRHERLLVPRKQRGRALKEGDFVCACAQLAVRGEVGRHETSRGSETKTGTSRKSTKPPRQKPHTEVTGVTESENGTKSFSQSIFFFSVPSVTSV